jgi:hypothetical protein
MTRVAVLSSRSSFPIAKTTRLAIVPNGPPINLSMPNIGIIVQSLNNAMSDNGSQVGDVALRPTRPKGHVAERRAAAPRSPRRLPRRRCAYVLL